MKPIQFALEATLDEMYTGASNKMRVTRMRVCKACGGKGCKPGANTMICQTCEGRRIVTKMVQVGPGMYAQSRAPCDDCHGTGDNVSEEDKCQKCKGEKMQEEQKEFEVKLDPGVPDNHVYTFAGEGNEIVSWCFPLVYSPMRMLET
ncbi:MAG: zinc finger domain-containing protein [Acidobacteriaceae bacterium]|nr:zinc finger domain-containing protein [Acidobacteriaceae bacterium]